MKHYGWYIVSTKPMCKGVPSNDNGLHDFLQVLHAGGGGGRGGGGKINTPNTNTEIYNRSCSCILYLTVANKSDNLLSLSIFWHFC